MAPLTAEEQKRFDAGKVVFLGLCAGCHNDDGMGKEKLGANLVTSKYVQAGVAFPIRILTQGKEGASDVRETRQSQTHKGPWTEAELSQLLASGGGRGRGGQ